MKKVNFEQFANEWSVTPRESRFDPVDPLRLYV